MAAHTTKTVVQDAFQWIGGTIAAANFPFWAKLLAFHTPGDGNLHVPSTTGRGTEVAKPTDWVVQVSTGEPVVISNAEFTTLFN